MKKLIYTVIAAALLLIAQTGFAQSHQSKTISWGGETREYLLYVPTNVSANAPVLFCLHGLGDEMANFANGFDFTAIANQHGWILVTPQALPFSLGGMMEVGTAWNAGITVEVPMLGTTAINGDVDDKGFLLAILDNLISTQSIDQSRVFCCGFSMGGFMSNRMAIESNRIRAIASINGTIAHPLASQTPTAKVSAMHIHGDADETVSFNDGSFTISLMGMDIELQLGLGAEATVDFWRTKNQCNTTPEEYNYPDAVADGLTFKRYLYTGGANNTKTAFIKVTGGEHYVYLQPANDIDYRTEIYNFFAELPAAIPQTSKQSLAVYPNPAYDKLFIEGSEDILHIYMYDMQGRQLTPQINANGAIDIAGLRQGVYMLKIETPKGLQITKIVKN